MVCSAGSQRRLPSTAESVNSKSPPPANEPRYSTDYMSNDINIGCSSPRDITIDVKVEAEAQSQFRQSPERSSSRRHKSCNDYSMNSPTTPNGHMVASPITEAAMSKDDGNKSGSTVIRRESSKKLTDKIPLISVIRRDSSKTSKDMKKLPITTEKYHQALGDIGPKPAIIDDTVADKSSPKISKYKPRDLHSSNDTMRTDHSSMEVNVAASLASLGNGAAVKPHQSSSSANPPPAFSPTSTTDSPSVSSVASREPIATSSVSDINDLDRYLDESDDDLDEVVELTKPVVTKKGRKKSSSSSKKSPKSRQFSSSTESSSQSIPGATIRAEPIRVSSCSI